VEDNGSGFEVSTDPESHTALANIRKRLELMCEGKLEITSGDEGGTTVTITIPLRMI
jgi:signal transduction histidine kinase